MSGLTEIEMDDIVVSFMEPGFDCKTWEDDDE